MLTPNTPLYSLAFRFLKQHENEHLSYQRHHLVQRCIDSLTESARVSYDTAKSVTMQALGELTAGRRRARIDCDHTTSYTLFLIDDKGERRIFTITELMALVDQAQLGRAT
jgi:hypothetical protein